MEPDHWDELFDEIYLDTYSKRFEEIDSAKEALNAANLAGVEPPAEILDAPGGFGRHSIPLADAGFRVTTADRSAVQLEEGRRRAGNKEWPKWVQADFRELPFEDESFDAVTMFDLLEHVPDDARAVAEALRVLRPGGYVLVSSPNERWRFPYYRLLQPLTPTDEDMIEEWGHVRRGYSLAELERLFGTAPSQTATFITPVTAIGHDLGFSKLPSRLRRAALTGLAPLTWAGYRLHRRNGPGTETASAWRKAG